MWIIVQSSSESAARIVLNVSLSGGLTVEAQPGTAGVEVRPFPSFSRQARFWGSGEDFSAFARNACVTVFPGKLRVCRGMAAQNALRDRSDAFLIHRLNCCHRV